MQFPTPEQVEAADHHQLGQWYAVLPFAETAGETTIFNRIVRRISDSGFELPKITRNESLKEDT